MPKVNHNGVIREMTSLEIEECEKFPSVTFGSIEERIMILEKAASSKYRIIPDNIEAVESFDKGELGWYHGELWQSLLDANVWTPEQYPAGWSHAAM